MVCPIMCIISSVRYACICGTKNKGNYCRQLQALMKLKAVVMKCA